MEYKKIADGKTINGIKYYLPKYLTPDQEAIFCHIINWKRKNITKDRGWYKGHEYDAFSLLEHHHMP